MRPQLLLALLATVFGLVTSSCFSPGDGQAPPLDTLYFPTGVALDGATLSTNTQGAPRYAYVASSDFDLQYRSSALVSYDLDALHALVPQSCSKSTDCGSGVCDNFEVNKSDPSYFCIQEVGASPCGSFGIHSNSDALLYPGRCNFIDPNKPQDGSLTLVADAVGIGAFATDVIFRASTNANPIYPGRLFLPVRGDGTLHWIDLLDGHFHCGQSETGDDSCDDAHRAGNQVFDNSNLLRLPPEPFGVDATADGAYVAVTSQTTGSVSLFSNDWDPSSVGARLESILSGLPSAPVAIAALPPLLGVEGTEDPGFLVAYSNAAQIDLVRVRSDADTATAYPRYVLAAAGTTPITANSQGFDSRGIVIDKNRADSYNACSLSCSGKTDADRMGCELACAQAAPQPNVYVANRAPASLLVGGMTPDPAYAAGSSGLPAFYDSIPLTTGPSRVVLGNVKVAVDANNVQVGDDSTNGDGTNGGPYALEARVFVVCFDSRRVYIYDPKRRVIDAVVPTGRGPYALAIDERRGFGYLAHFTDSYLGVISLDQRFPQSYASIIASIGQPTPPRASK